MAKTLSSGDHYERPHDLNQKSTAPGRYRGSALKLLGAIGLLRAVLCTFKIAPGDFVELRSHPIAHKLTIFRGIGRRDWIRTNDPHHVKVVL
jgi:hypothetical protein